MNVKRLRLFALALSFTLLLGMLSGFCGALAAPERQYYIEVDIDNQIVTVYDAATGGIERQMLCSTGEKLEWTPVGEFTLPKDEKNSDRDPWYQIGDYFVRYATRISGKVLFHSIPYTRKSLNSLDPDSAKRFGFPASHGCVRLRWQDARFIALNCPAGTRVKIYQSGKRDDELRALLYQSSFDASKGFSYECFLGISSDPGVMDRRSSGQEVLNLQYRLRDLGLYDGGLNGAYDSATVNAVRLAQFMMGDDATGLASPEFLRKIYGDAAPTDMNVRLETGMSGPAVRVLQENLRALRLYDGGIDSVYDVEVVEAVKQFQRAYCYEQDGVATPEVQKAIAYEVGNLKGNLGDSDYTCDWVSAPVALAKVKAEAGLSMKQSASQDSRSVEVLSTGENVFVLKKGKEWSQVRLGEDMGYVLNRFVTFFTCDVSVLRYVSVNHLTYTLGCRPDDYYAGASLPCKSFERYLAVHDQPLDVDDMVNYVTVETGSEGTLLNLRAAPDAASAVLTTVGDGSSLKVMRRYSEWTEVTYQGTSGYLMNCYLSFWTGPQDALEAEQDGASLVVSGSAVVSSVTGKPAEVFDAPSGDARVLGHLPDGVELEVVETSGGWCRIRYEGHEGYMIVEDLQFLQTPVDNRATEELRT